MKTKHILILLFLVVCNILYAQESFFTSDKWTDYIEQVAEDAEDTERIEALYIELSYLIDNPLNINEANREELLKIPFLTEA
ncbi:helix-hairpin-helix domain-containing protein, partial [Parabacteroides sp. OttesenSCG-928-K15]|nr:helix-hairpin-helix domain-containing protein [Parabacteroides sp. OttesenSCG-928-K15]